MSRNGEGIGWELNELSRQVIGAALEVHKVLGPGFLEETYEKALCLVLSTRGIPFNKQVPISVRYKGVIMNHDRVDLLVADSWIVELKAVEDLAPIRSAQLLS